MWKTDGGIICESIYCNKEGRVLIVKVIINSNVFYVVNLCASNLALERINFFKQLFKVI